MRTMNTLEVIKGETGTKMCDKQKTNDRMTLLPLQFVKKIKFSG
jgi:hypothetical protein